jgi:DNA-binding NtrC family response regulator
VDDDKAVREILQAILQMEQFEAEALHLIDDESFDALISDLHMPGAGDGFTVISTMRHRHPHAVTLLFTGFPALKEAMDAILLQADEISVKPMPIPEMIALIRDRLAKRVTRRPTNTERVASILEKDASLTVADWLSRVNHDPEVTRITLPDHERTGLLPKLLQELVGKYQKQPKHHFQSLPITYRPESAFVDSETN